MEDIQNNEDDRGIEIQEVGISNLKIPIQLENGISSVIKARAGVNLSAKQRGIHMSRIALAIEDMSGKKISQNLIEGTLKQLKDQNESESAFLLIKFPYFRKKTSPISKYTSHLSYEASIDAEIDDNNRFYFTLSINIPISTLCPCSKAISESNAHNQRAYVFIKIKSKNWIKIESILNIVEAEASSDLFTVIKRGDEKHITEKMYSNPKFVEDVVRDVTNEIKSLVTIDSFEVICKSQESIHNHDAYAIVRTTM